MSEPVFTAEQSPSFITSEEAHKAAYDNGFRVELGRDGGWLGYRSTTARGDAWVARDVAQNMWLLALTHAGVAAELAMPTARGTQAPATAVYAFATVSGLHGALDRAYKLGVSLPNAPLDEFRTQTAALPRSTEAERLTVVRVGQDIFRDALLDYWNGCCPLTGITDRALLRASHIVPWAECTSDEQRLDVHNGLLLSSLWDCAFDTGLVSVAETGEILRSPRLSDAAAHALRLDGIGAIPRLTAAHRKNLSHHRMRHGFMAEDTGTETS